MRVTIDGFEIEGTPDEIAALLRARQAEPPSSSTVSMLMGAEQKVSPGDDERFASEKIAFRALRRLPLSVAQRALLKALLEAYPNWTKASDLHAATNYNANQFGGLLGALGRRLSQTDGYVRDSALIEWMWDTDENEYLYRLPPPVLSAVRRIAP